LPYLDPEDIERVTDKTRKLGLIVVRGTQVSLVSPQEGVEEIANPFIAAEE
jgi:U6 snRNA-associated Sm-like protein LSm7